MSAKPGARQAPARYEPSLHVRPTPRIQVVLARAGARLCALRVEDVIETFRPLPVAPLPGTPDFVAGAAVVRGEPLPVVHLGAFLGSGRTAPARYVVVRCGSRRAVLAVDAVVGVTQLPEAPAAPVPLLDAACAGAVEALSATDRELLFVLRAARVVPEEAWRAVGLEQHP